jgi:SPRY domain-containing SOCS box protein 3
MMFGIGTKKARLHVDAFVNMLGEDESSWGLSHKAEFIDIQVAMTTF